MEEDNELNVVDDVSATVVTNITYTYECNDVCLTISPYDNYKKISLYQRVDGVDIAFDVDRSDMYKYYLQFGDSSSTRKKIVTVQEYKDYYTSTGDTILLSSNELLFKITQKQAYEILSLSSNVFNVVRELTVEENTYGDTSTEVQSIFTGRWATTQDRKDTNNSLLIQELQDRVKDLLNTNDELNVRVLELMNEIAELTTENEKLKDYEQYKDMYEQIANEQELSNEYTGTAIEYDAKYIKVNIDDEKLESQVNEYLDTINT